MCEHVKLEQDDKSNRVYQLVPPDGGWGYLVAFALVVYTILSSTEVEAFGLLYGDFLLEITGDKAYGISLTNGIFFTSQCFSGFFVYILVSFISFQKVGFIGATSYLLGSFGSIFMSDLSQMIIFVSIFQGIGLGLITNAMYSSLYSYFTKKKNMVMGVSHTIVMIGIFVGPFVAEIVIASIGFRKSLWVVTGFAGVIFLTVALLQPVQKHMREVLVDDVSDNDDFIEEKTQKYESLLTKEQELSASSIIINLGARLSIAETIISSHDKKRSWINIIDWSLLKNYIYWSVSLGAGSVFFSDAAFVAIMPAVLGDIGHPSSDVAVMMTVYFGCDLCGRICYSVINLFYQTRNRYIYYTGTIITAIFRIIFSYLTSYSSLTSVIGVLGFVRGFLQITQTLNLVEEFKEKFPSAFSLMFCFGGVYSFVFGLLSSYVKYLTKNNIYVLHSLTFPVIGCVVLWTSEFIYRMYLSKNKAVKNTNK